MKIVFSTKNVKKSSFINLCKYAYEYGYSGFEIYDAITERRKHTDSILRNDMLSESRRKLVNRNLEVSALCYPYALDSSEADSAEIKKYVAMAARAGIDKVIRQLVEGEGV